MAIADTITSMQTHTSNAYTMIGYGTDLTGINKNLENLSSTIFEAFLEALRTPDTLFTNLPKKSGSGANISLNDTANAPMRIELGASELTQDGTPTPDSPQDIHTISGSNKVVVNGKNLFNDYSTASETFHTIVKSKVSNGIKLNGTYDKTSGGDLWLTESNSLSYSNNMTLLKANTQYTISIQLLEGTMNVNSVQGKISSRTINNYTFTWNYKDLTFSNNKWTSTFTTGLSDIYVGAIRFVFNTSSTGEFTNAVLGIQVEENSTFTTYEPYISQEAEVDLGYENLFNKDSANILNSYINASGVISASTTDRMIWLPIKENTDYAFQITQYSLASVQQEDDIQVGLFNTQPANNVSGTRIFRETRGSSVSNKSFTYTFNSGNNTYVGIKIGTLNKSDYNQTIGTLQLNEGTTALPYTPYGKAIEYSKIGNYEDKFIRTSGKNLFDANLTTKNCSVNNQIIKITASATDTYIQGGSTYSAENKFLTLPAGTYYLKSTKSNVRVQFYGDNASLDTSSTQPITLSSATNFGGIRVRSTDSSSLTDVSFGIMLSTENIDYEPYGSNEWYIKKNIGKVVLDGTETFVDQAQSQNDIFYTAMQVSDMKYTTQNLLSNYFKKGNNPKNNNGTIGALYQNYLYFGINTSIIGANDSDSVATKTTAFKTWLGTHNTNIYYPISTPTYTQITGTLETQLENIYQKLLSYTETTNISQVNNDLSFVMSVSAIEE